MSRLNNGASIFHLKKKLTEKGVKMLVTRYQRMKEGLDAKRAEMQSFKIEMPNFCAAMMEELAAEENKMRDMTIAEASNLEFA